MTIVVRSTDCGGTSNKGWKPLGKIFKDMAAEFLYFSYCQQISYAEPNQQWTDPTSNVCVSKSFTSQKVVM